MSYQDKITDSLIYEYKQMSSGWFKTATFKQLT